MSEARRRALMAQIKTQPLPSFSALPDEYQRVECISTSGNVYFTIPVPTSGNRILFYCKPTNATLQNVLYHSGTSGWSRSITASASEFSASGFASIEKIFGSRYNTFDGVCKAGYAGDQSAKILSNDFTGDFLGATITTYDMVPCYRKSDGVIGLYWSKKNAFYTNNGTGIVEKGADVL